MASGNTDGAANYFLPGRVDEVAVYGSALSTAPHPGPLHGGHRARGGNQPPVAVAGGSPTSGTIPLSVAFSSAGSSDPDGTIASYAWDLDGDGAFDDSSAANPSFQYTVAGSYSVRLRVTDNQGAPDDSDPLTITAQPPGGSTYSQQVLADTPASYWRLGEASGTTAADSSGANRTGQLPEHAHARPAGRALGRHEHGRRLQRHHPVRVRALSRPRSTRPPSRSRRGRT